MPENNELNEKVEAIGKLLQMFKMERFIYLGVTIISFFALMSCACYMVSAKGGNQLPIVIGMFGSSGGIAFTCGRLLKMWSDAMQILSPFTDKEK
jgi:hypothetical protein